MPEASGAPLLPWTRQHPAPRRQAPSIEEIVRAAIEIADNDGLAALSMRRVAADLGSGTASLYRYMTGRDELLDLMIDEVRGEVGLPTLSSDWRADLTSIAQRMRTTLLRHPWLGTELTGRPALGPNSLRQHDAALAAAVQLTSDITFATVAIDVVTAYVHGAVANELAEHQAQRRTGLTKEQWQASVGPYLRDVIAGGAYPHFARRVTEADHIPPEQRFALGLDLMLDGIAARAVTPATDPK